jgi:hypothetical protein
MPIDTDGRRSRALVVNRRSSAWIGVMGCLGDGRYTGWRDAISRDYFEASEDCWVETARCWRLRVRLRELQLRC